MYKNIESNEKVEKTEYILSYWKRQLSDAPPLIELLIDHPRTANDSNQRSNLTFSISTLQLHALTELSNKSGCSIDLIMLTCFNTFLYRYTQQEDIVINYLAPTYNKSEDGELASLQKNVIPLRTSLSGNLRFIDLLQQVSDVFTDASSQKYLPFKMLTEALLTEMDINVSLLFQVLFSFNQLDESKNGELLSAGQLLQNSGKLMDISLSFNKTKEGLAGVWNYNAGLFDPETIERISSHFLVIVEGIIANANEKISQLPMLGKEERHQLLSGWNCSTVLYPRDKRIHQLFEDQAIKTPEATALVFGKERLTYKELNERSNQVAHHLMSKGVREETLVPVCLGRSLEMIPAMLGILKAGGAYVPIDPEYPAERIKFMLEDTGATVLISNKESRLSLQTIKEIDVIELDEQFETIKHLPVNNPDVSLSSHNLAYVIYTSGSTGQPKGVMIEHNALADHSFGLIKSADLMRCKSFALFSPLVFDAGHSIIHSAFLLGATLHVLSKDLILDSEKLVSYLTDNPIDCIKIVPSLWLSYANANNVVLSNKVMIFGGEAFSLNIYNYLKKLSYNGDVFNHYGPTETTIGKCIYKVSFNEQYRTIPIGKPFSNTQLYVADQYNQLVPVGVAGELYIGGEGLAREYLNQPELTSQKFIANPFTANSSSRVYKTGDKVRWTPDGNIEYHGRIDEQVKIRGYRIEPGEIENVLLKSKLVTHGVVLARKDKQGNNRLVGYIVPGEQFSREALTEDLRKKLPEYMVPLVWVEMQSLPLTRNGKVDKKQLPNPDTEELLKAQYMPPENKTEEMLAKILQEVLKIERIGIHDNFFELGGNSVQAVQVFSKIRKACGKQLPLSALFEANTIEKLSVFLNKQEKTALSKSGLVAMQAHGSKPPLFCIHAGAGTVLFYRELTENLGTDQPVYGLQAKGLNGNEPPHTRVENMAAHYINEIKTVQPEGPYYLVGYCFGGIIAFEMSQQLLKLGHEVALLATINSRSPTYVQPPDLKKMNVEASQNSKVPSGKIAFHLQELAKLSIAGKLLYPFNRLKHKFWTYETRSSIRKRFYKYYLSRKLPLPALLGRYYFLDTNSIIAKAYKPKKYSGKMIVFRSPELFPVSGMGWGDWVTGGIETIDISGKHANRRSIMEEPFVGDVAKELMKRLAKNKINDQQNETEVVKLREAKIVN